MRKPSENESWIVDRVDLVIKKKAQSGTASLNGWERLVYCLWVADYMMRNAGDFANAKDMYPDFREDAQRFAKQLSLPVTCEAFSLSQRKLQREYLNRFEAICDEIKNAEPSALHHNRPPSQLPVPPEIESPDSQRKASSDGYG